MFIVNFPIIMSFIQLYGALLELKRTLLVLFLKTKKRRSLRNAAYHLFTRWQWFLNPFIIKRINIRFKIEDNRIPWWNRFNL